MERRFYLVDAQVLPEVFLKVVRAKELLASGEARSISAATRAVDLSRSAFYKYKDCIFDSENDREVVTVMATLRDETGALQSLLAGISAAGASIVTINQSTPENGAALVAVTIRTDTMQMTPEELTEKLSRALRPVLGRLFPSSRSDPELAGELSCNMSANLLGLGNAATPAGIRAAQRLHALSGKEAASDELCRLAVLNTASIQLLPTTAAALRSACGAENAFDILPAVWISSAAGVAAGLLAERLFRRAP